MHGAYYYITVVVTAPHSSSRSSRALQVFVGGKEIVCIEKYIYVIRLYHASSVDQLGMQTAGIFVLAPQTPHYSNVSTRNIPFMYRYVECPYILAICVI